MLVLTRKTGEEIVLPEHGVTIGVVAIGGKRVRLGISAPFDVPVHRRELLDHPAEHGPSTLHASSSRTDFEQRLERRIRLRTRDRIRNLRIERFGEQVIVRGRSRSNYDRQLAYSAAMEVLNASRSDRRETLKVDIEVDKPR
jgi:carbon storage regulator